MILILLAVLWIAVLLPPWLKGRTSGASRPIRTDGQSIAMHRTQLSVLNNALNATGPTGATVIPFRRPEAGAPVADSLSGPQPVQRSFAGLAPTPSAADFGPVAQDPWTTATGVSMGMSSEQARRRRRNVLLGLLGVAVVTLLAAVTFGGTFVALNLIADVALLGYVVLLVMHQQRQLEAANKVRPIRPVGYQPGLQSAPDYLVQRSASH